MLSPFRNPKSNYDDLERAVSQLRSILVIPSLSTGADGARAERRAADADLLKTREECAAIFKRTARPVHRGIHPEALAATARIAAAEARCARAREAFGKAKEKREEQFLKEVGDSLNQAADTLSDVIRLVNDAVDPLRELHLFAVQHGLPLPRMLSVVPQLLHATRVMTATLNSATAPSRRSNRD